MKRIQNLVFLVLVVVVLSLGGCASPPSVGGGMKSAPAPAPYPKSAPAPTSSAQRYAELENLFYDISVSDNISSQLSIREVLSLCESGEVPLMVSLAMPDTMLPYISTTVREYVEMLGEVKEYQDRITRVLYNSEGKVTGVLSVRELKIRREEGEMGNKMAEVESSIQLPVTGIGHYRMLEDHFRAIADNTDEFAASEHMAEVLQMCMTPEIPVEIFSSDNPETPLAVTTIREYMEALQSAGEFTGRVGGMIHNAYGNIASVRLVR